MKTTIVIVSFFLIVLIGIFAYCQSIESHDFNQSIKDILSEANENFTYKGKPIHPALIREFEGWMSDSWMPITVSVDVIAAEGTNECFEDDVEIRDNGYIFFQREGERDYCYYKWLGRLNNGLHVLDFGEGDGGSGVFQDVFFVRFDTDKGITPEGEPYDRLLMSIVRKHGLGDRDNGEIKVLPDRVILGKSKYREEPLILTFEQTENRTPVLAQDASGKTSQQETRGDMDEMWLWKPFEAKEPFILYSAPSKSSKQVGEVKKDAILYLLDMKGDEWYLLRETSPPYRRGWVSGGSEEDDAVDYKVAPLCGTLIASEKAFLSGNHHLYYRRDKMPFTTVVADTATKVGEVNDKIIELCRLGYKDVYFLYPREFTTSEDKDVYAICVGAYKAKDEAKKVKKDLESKSYQPLIYNISAE